MKATKQVYLSFRRLFIQMGFSNEVKRLDVHFELVFIYNKNGELILIK